MAGELVCFPLCVAVRRLLGKVRAASMGVDNVRGAVNFLPEIANRAGEQAERLPEFPTWYPLS